MVNISSEIISTVAGSCSSFFTDSTGLTSCANGYSGDGKSASSALLYNPHGLAFDNEGNLLISDSYNNVIRKLTLSSGIISTLIGVFAVDSFGYILGANSGIFF